MLAWIPTIPGLSGNQFTWQAKYIVYTADNLEITTIVDEHGLGSHNPRDKWLSLGVYYMNSKSYVYTTDATGEIRVEELLWLEQLCCCAEHHFDQHQHLFRLLPLWHALGPLPLWKGHQGAFSLGARAAFTLCQSDSNNGLPVDGRGSALVRTNPPVNIAVAVNQSSSSQVMSYTGIASPSKTVVLSYLVKNYIDLGTWNSGIAIQNTHTGPLTITARFYNLNGVQVGEPFVWGNIDPGESDILYLPNKSDLPNGFIGSAVLTADNNFVAIGNASCSSGCSDDTSLTYNGINR